MWRVCSLIYIRMLSELYGVYVKRSIVSNWKMIVNNELRTKRPWPTFNVFF
jgi:hypothetical protein